MRLDSRRLQSLRHVVQPFAPHAQCVPLSVSASVERNASKMKGTLNEVRPTKLYVLIQPGFDFVERFPNGVPLDTGGARMWTPSVLVVCWSRRPSSLLPSPRASSHGSGMRLPHAAPRRERGFQSSVRRSTIMFNHVAQVK